MAKKDLQEEYKALSGQEAPDEMTVKLLEEAIAKLKEEDPDLDKLPQEEIAEAESKKKGRVTIGSI